MIVAVAERHDGGAAPMPASPDQDLPAAAVPGAKGTMIISWLH